MIELFIKGVVIGLILAAPVGAVGALCIRVTLERGRLHGLFAGLGAAFADSLFGAVAAYGLTTVTNLMADWQFEIRVVGVVVMLLLAIRIAMKKMLEQEDARESPLGHKLERSGTMATAFGTTFVLTVTNPVTIIAFATVFAAAGVSLHSHEYGEAVVVGGVFVGSCVWWLFLSLFAGMFRGHFSGAMMHKVNLFTAALLVISAAIVITSLIKPAWVPFIPPLDALVRSPG